MSDRKSVSASIEARLLEVLRGLGTGLPCVGLLETAGSGEAREQDLSSVQARVFSFAQTTERFGFFTVSAEVRLTVEQAESAGGEAFLAAHEAVALWLERVMLEGGCVSLETDEAYVDGLQRTGDDKGFDSSDGAWYAVWNVTISGRIKQEE